MCLVVRGVFISQPRKATSFREAHGEPGGHELTARINLLPATSPDASLESRIKAIENKRTRDEGNIFKQVGAAARMFQHSACWVFAISCRRSQKCVR